MTIPAPVKTMQTVYSMLPNGTVLAGALSALDFLGYYGSPDPVGEAIAALQKEMDAIKKDVELLKQRINQVVIQQATDENQGRLKRLDDIRIALEKSIHDINNKPADMDFRDSIAFGAGQLADKLLDEMDLWNWTDIETVWTLDENGQPAGEPASNALPADFKFQLAGPVYTMAILTWIMAIDLDTAGNVAVVERKYGAQLRRHIAQNRVRDGFDDLSQAPATLPENVMTRVVCRPVAQHNYALGGECLFSIQCENRMERRTFPVRDVTLTMPPGSQVSCLAPDNLGLQDERDIESQQGVGNFGQLAELLEKVSLTGSLRQQFIGTFGPISAQGIMFLYAIGQDGNLSWYRQGASADSTALVAWEGPKNVGHGWQGFTRVYPAGGAMFYGLKENGDLLWYRHDGFNEGSMAWTGPVTVGNGWNHFKSIIAAGDGVLYAVQDDGVLLWYRHLAYRNGGGTAADWIQKKKVGTGWENCKDIFSVGKGILYAVANDGTLSWYRHKGNMDGSFAWDGPNKVGNGWQNFREIFGHENGFIFAVQANGDVLRYQHLDWQTGGNRWTEPVVAAKGFGGYRQLFSPMPATPQIN